MLAGLLTHTGLLTRVHARYLTLPVERMPLYHNFLAAAQRFVKDHALFAAAVKVRAGPPVRTRQTAGMTQRFSNLVSHHKGSANLCDLARRWRRAWT